MSLGLVASYGSSSGEESEEEEEVVSVPARALLPTPKVEENFTQLALQKSKEPELDISDDEDFVTIQQEDTPAFLEEPEPDLFSLISKKLPHAKLASVTPVLLDTTEDLSSIPEKKDYGERIEEPPAKKKKRDGPVRIGIPALKDLHKSLAEEEEEDDRPRPLVPTSRTGSGLFALLPQPQNKTTRRPLDTTAPETGEERRPPNIFNIHKEGDGVEATTTSSNLRPQGVRTSGLVPHVLAKPGVSSKAAVKTAPAAAAQKKVAAAAVAVTPADDSDSDEEDLLGVNSGAYFPVPELPKAGSSSGINPTLAASSSSSYVYGMRRPPPAILPPSATVGGSSASYVSLSVADDYGPATAPYPPTAASAAAVYGGELLVDNDEAITRLAGKAAKRKEFKEDFAIIDVHEDDMKADPRVWLTKAMTEEMAPMPNRKGPKGLVKSRHQITYLAHQAKERDWELKQEWAQARENRRASANKYGF